jgi:glycosyltransferase involved in cell wall biosynthesis
VSEVAATSLTLSVVMPLYNAERLIEATLAPLLAMLSRGEIAQVIVVDDGSTDGSVDLVGRHAEIRLVRGGSRAGPSAARNLGAREATGDYLWFVDSDVVVADDAARVLLALVETDAPAAVIGSYDDSPAARNFLSQYKNLVHSYYHHRGRREASTFWTGCGAVQRRLFLSLGGFDAERYPYPSIEDIELGYRIRAAGGRIVLEPNLLGKHLKEWRLRNLLHTEIFRRAIPWSLLMFERKELTDDLNVGKSERIRAVLAAAWMMALIGAFAAWLPYWVPGALIGAALIGNRRLVAFFAARKGIAFAAGAFLFHQFYYLYSSLSFVFALVQHLAGRRRQPR